jgi:hypothetical protein
MKTINWTVYSRDGGWTVREYDDVMHQYELEDFPHESEMHWFFREIPFALLVLIVLLTFTKVFGTIFLVSIAAASLPFLIVGILLGLMRIH